MKVSGRLCISLHGSGSTILIPGFDCDSNMITASLGLPAARPGADLKAVRVVAGKLDPVGNRQPLLGGLDWWFGDLHPWVFVEGNWEAPGATKPPTQTTN